MLADDARPAAAVGAEVEVVEQLLHLAFDEAVLLLDHEDVLEPARERADAHWPQRPGHADLVDADAQPRAGIGVEAEVLERLKHVQMRLAGGHDAQPLGRRVDPHDRKSVGSGKSVSGRVDLGGSRSPKKTKT